MSKDTLYRDLVEASSSGSRRHLRTISCITTQPPNEVTTRVQEEST